jgi:hypothetical protein
MTEEKFQEFLRDAAQDYHQPPEPPRVAMWQAIRAAQRAQQAQRARRAWRWQRGAFRSPVVRWGVGIAAALVIGIGIGRLMPRGAGTQLVEGPDAEPAAETAGPSAAYQFAANEHLGQVEMFLTAFRVDARTGQTVSDSPDQARRLLGTTRLLLDSPASDDTQLRTLLEDIELVLVQISQFAGQQDNEELDLIDDSMERRSVLLRLQTALTGQPGMAGVQGVL